MADRKPTKAQAALLRAIEAGSFSTEDHSIETYVECPRGWFDCFTERKHGLCFVGHRLTETGRAALAAYEEGNGS